MTTALRLLIFILLAAAMAAAEAQSLAGCLDKCGDVDIPYPFGVGVQPGTSRNCSLKPSFRLTCQSSTLFLGTNLPVSNISVQDGQMDILMFVSKNCYNQHGKIETATMASLELYSTSLTISSDQNKFVSIGCNTMGVIGIQTDFNYGGGCMALCDSKPSLKDMNNDEACSGIGCCKVDIPFRSKNITFTASTASINDADVSSFNNCSYAFVVKQDWFNFSLDYLRYFPHDKVPLVLDWTISNDTCVAASTRSDYACNTSNTECYDSTNGYNCKCKPGFEGNPYHPDGCHDVNECDTHNNCSKEAQCHNFDGGYSCSCPAGYTGDGYNNGTRCTPQSNLNLRLIIALGVGIGAGFLCLFLLGYKLYQCHKQKRERVIKENLFRQNGGLLLQEKMSSYENRERAKLFTAEELERATDNYNQSRFLGQGGFGTVYKGMLPDGSVIAVKKSREIVRNQIETFINEVVILSQINHRNIVKLLGWCLETEAPLLVYEFIPNGTLSHHIHCQEPEATLSWDTRLRIACEVASAVTYMHFASSIPIFHRDIKTSNILLDHKYSAKVSDFGTSRSVPHDKTHLTTVVQGTFGYIDPEYFRSSQFTDKSDVYSFGVVLVELITARKPITFPKEDQGQYLVAEFISLMKKDQVFEILDARVVGEGRRDDILSIANLAMRCLRLSGQKRPSMREVSAELEVLRRTQNSLEITKCSQEFPHYRKSAMRAMHSESDQESTGESSLLVFQIDSTSI